MSYRVIVSVTTIYTLQQCPTDESFSSLFVEVAGWVTCRHPAVKACPLAGHAESLSGSLAGQRANWTSTSLGTSLSQPACLVARGSGRAVVYTCILNRKMTSALSLIKGNSRFKTRYNLYTNYVYNYNENLLYLYTLYL